MTRKSAQTKAMEQRYVITLDAGTDHKKYYTNSGIFVRVSSLARRFLSKESANDHAGRLGERFGRAAVSVEKERID